MSDYLSLVRTHCPKCFGLELRTLRSVRDQGDGSSLRRTLCLACGHRFKIVYEPPLPKYGKDR